MVAIFVGRLVVAAQEFLALHLSGFFKRTADGFLAFYRDLLNTGVQLLLHIWVVTIANHHIDEGTGAGITSPSRRRARDDGFSDRIQHGQTRRSCRGGIRIKRAALQQNRWRYQGTSDG